ncbi:hypothetical protein [Priestia aryabhattai]
MEIEQYYTMLTYKYGDEEEVVLCDFVKLNEDKYDFVIMNELIDENNPYRPYRESEVHDNGNGNYIVEFYENLRLVDSIQVTVEFAFKMGGHIFKLQKLYI